MGIFFDKSGLSPVNTEIKNLKKNCNSCDTYPYFIFLTSIKINLNEKTITYPNLLLRKLYSI